MTDSESDTVGPHQIAKLKCRKCKAANKKLILIVNLEGSDPLKVVYSCFYDALED